ncbi:hypothetical protein [Flavobacterium gawalongense]|uniref:Lipoprotein n=1 Tax=Flavobacterium gawalongense TaxID=2594432 RepID=A0A553BN29_9FLAO|nr:hypothetical protein [Flavobacterium gawalongense]TRX00137.1 hypothetical protein FNW33_13085 [Flavobacterium gawalongense]TRX04885.1 hypothetical protein FNW12_12560 [Flavobacterium gawalongense]TRX09663.1 hypothetical protein FNW11_09165 [Flavobacterium gawalongense]TRX10853.1 hypothetical protein FNW10_08855 [Flavobacterium gawalongense]TRX28068.1 hypothetical protein FNW38_08635 [Flavobacterium gawalongense]
MRDLNKIFCLLFVFVFFSCKKGGDDNKGDSEIRDRYFNLEKVGWKSRVYIQKVDDIGFVATEVPIQYYLLKDKGNENLVLVDSLYEENKRERIIEFTFQQDEEKDILSKDFTGMEYTNAVKYMSFGLDKDFYVVTSKKDTIPCSGVSYERSYKIAPYQKVLLFFSGIDPNDKIQLVYNDFLFRKGTLKFKFKDTYTQIAL